MHKPCNPSFSVSDSRLCTSKPSNSVVVTVCTYNMYVVCVPVWVCLGVYMLCVCMCVWERSVNEVRLRPKPTWRYRGSSPSSLPPMVHLGVVTVPCLLWLLFVLLGICCFDRFCFGVVIVVVLVVLVLTSVLIPPVGRGGIIIWLGLMMQLPTVKDQNHNLE